ncbi:MAG: metalloregulator ArsR/SmtB family transcription factor [Rhodospirillaceae bacterium]|nr:metalloregulator ArsR/SmtB family transcription factor [Rhodospirillaceae bacterium]
MTLAAFDIADLRGSAKRAGALLKAMANERRLLILCCLATGEQSVGSLEKQVGLSQSALSQHLARLRRDRLVTTRRAAQTIYYALASDEVGTVMAALHAIYCAPPGVAKPGRRKSAG